MKPIAPRHRNPIETKDEGIRLARPILTIPDWNDRPSEMVASDGENIDFEVASSEKLPDEPNRSDSTTVEKMPSERKLRDTIHVYWSTAKNRAELKLPRRLPEAIRGILPGIGIAISLIFVWFFIQGGPNPPTPTDLVNQDSSPVIKPITEAPLRRPGNPSVAVNQPAPQEVSTAKVEVESEPLFDHFAIIERKEASVSTSAKEQQSEVSSRERVDIASRTAVEGTFAKTKSRLSQTAVAPTAPPTNYEWSPGAGQSSQETDPLAIGQRPTVETKVNQGAPANPNPTLRRRELQPERGQSADPSTPDLDPQYSYQTTDPSTYKDPDYVVPPITRRTKNE